MKPETLNIFCYVSFFFRRNCLPGKGDVTEELCTSKGCLWDAEDANPSCFYPQDFQNYQLNGEVTSSDGGHEFSMDHLGGSNFFSEPISKVHVSTQYISENQLRVKIFDEETARYEVPLQMGGGDGFVAGNELYNAEYPDTGTTVVIKRKSTDEEVARLDVGRMIFEDQFLQISMDLTSSSVYGLGENERNSFRHEFNGKIYGMFTRDESVKQDANLYGQHPFFMRLEKSGKASGIFLKNSNAMEVELAPHSTIIWRTTGGILDFHMFMGPTPEDVIQQYTSAVGRPMMPPYWALGFQLSKYGYGNLDNMRAVVEENRNFGVPHDVQYGDVDTMERRLDFTVDPVDFSDLPDFVDVMRNDYNMRYVIILDPAISGNETESYPPYSDGEAADVFIRQENGDILYGNVWPYLPGEDGVRSAHVAFPDFMKSDTADWWKEQITNFYNELKFDGIWIDMNEPANFADGSVNGCPDSNYENPPFYPNIKGDDLNSKTLCMTAKQQVSGSEELHYNVHSLYGWSQAQPTLEACRASTGKRCFVISRSTYPGAGQYTGHWFGDNTSKWSHLHASIISMFDFSLFGFGYTGADICGFFLNASEPLCRRWSQLGAFYPFSRNHANLATKRQDPASFGEAFAFEVRDVLLIRYRLLPYLYTLFYHAHISGTSVVRPLLNVFPDDPATQDVDRQFMWGSALLISPVLEEGKTDVDVYLPDSRWFNYYDGKEMATRKSYTTLDAPEDHINLHISGGNIIIAQEPAITTFESRQNAFELLVALDDDMKSTGSMYWDDGDVIDVKSDSIVMNFTCEMNVLESHIERDNYADSDMMQLRRVVVMGLRDTVMAVYVNNDVIYTFEQDSITKMLTIEVPRTQLNQEFKIMWDFTDEKSRIDCWPDLTTDTAGDLTQEKCIQRNCLYEEPTSEGPPPCYFDNSKTHHKYKITSGGNSGTKETNYLEAYPSNQIYGAELEHIQLEQTWETENRFHFKFKDPYNERWEVPDSLVDLSHARSDQLGNKNDALYRVQREVTPFSLKIYHKDDMNTPLIDTSIGPLKFGDQFLQISTALPSTNIYGFGGHNHKRLRHDLNWRRWAIFTRDNAPIDPWNLYSHHPFFMATTEDGSVSFGLFLHNTNAMDIVLQPHPAMTYRVTGGVLDFYFFISDTPEGLIQQYHQLVGPPVMPPYWSMGFQLSKWNYSDLATVREIYEEMRAAGIPYDVQFGDIDYMEDKKDFTVDQVAYAGLPQFINELHDNGMRYIVITDPGIKIEEGYPAYDEGLEQNVFILRPDGVTPLETEVWPGPTHHPDFTHPNVSRWWTDQYEYLYHDLDITFDGLWIDMDEPANFQPDNSEKLEAMNCTGKYNIPAYMPNILGYGIGLHDKSICMDNLHYNHTLHYNVHSLYGHTMSTSTHQTLTEMMPEKRSLVLTRSSYAGTGRYAVTWTGDNQSFWSQLQDSITAIIEHNMFGFAMVGADICGFWGEPSMELCLRWTQVGAFYPFSRNHNADGWPPQHPTAFKNETMTEVSRNVLLTRYRLLPFMYTQFYQANQHGGTFARSLAHEFPADEETRNINYQFLIGSSFLVTPVLQEGASSVIGYFPASERWFDYYTGKEMEESGKYVKLHAPLEYINLHVRGGYILPMQEPNVTTTLSRKNPMKLLVALDTNNQAAGSLYWDDGEARHVGDNFALLHFSCSKQPDNSYQLDTTVEQSPSNLDRFDTLFFDEIFVAGLAEDQISSVNINGEEMTDFDYNKEGFLRLHSMNLPVDSDNSISWTSLKTN